jgi:hypothetical protein
MHSHIPYGSIEPERILSLPLLGMLIKAEGATEISFEGLLHGSLLRKLLRKLQYPS